MKAVRLHAYDEWPTVDEVADPTIEGPHDVIVRIGGAGVCRTDIHIWEGQWAPKTGVDLPEAKYFARKHLSTSARCT